MHKTLRKCVSLLLLFVMLISAASPAAAADSGAGVGWSDGEKGFAVRITSYGGDVSRVTAGERFAVEFWISGSDPAAVSIPLRWDPAVAAVVEETTGEPVRSGRKQESDLVRGAGFRPGDTCYDNSVNDDYEALYWNGKPVFTENTDEPEAGYPYIDNERGFARFLYYTNSPTKGTEEQMFLRIYFKALAAGNPGFRFATSSQEGGSGAYDPASPRGMQVSFVGTDSGSDDDSGRLQSETYTQKVIFPSFRATDGSEMDKEPEVPSVGTGGGSGGSGGSGNQTGQQGGADPEQKPETPQAAVMKPGVHLSCWPKDYAAPVECTTELLRSDSETIWRTDEYTVSEKALTDAAARVVQAKQEDIRQRNEQDGVVRTAGSGVAVLARMPEQIIDKEEYAATVGADTLISLRAAGAEWFYLETSWGFVGADLEAVAEKLESGADLRIAVRPAGAGAAAASGISAASGTAGADAGGGVTVSLKSGGAELNGFSRPALRLILPFKKSTEGGRPSAFTDRAFGSAGGTAPLAVCRYDEAAGAVLIQSPAGGAISLAEQQPAVFSDLETVSWAKEHIELLSQIGVVSGTGAGAFSPEDKVTREQFAKMAAAALGLYASNPKMPFTDIGRSNPFYSYIACANARGIVSGVSENRFDGESRISRQDLAVIVNKACLEAGIKLPAVSTAPVFADDNRIEGYAKDAVYALVRAGIISGVGENRFDPQGEATRAEACRILGAVYELTEQLL